MGRQPRNLAAAYLPMINDMRFFHQFLFTASLFLIVAIMGGCGDDNPVNSFSPEISNITDTFIFRANNVYIVTETLTYSWNNTGDQATIEHLTGRSGGTATLVIFDADGTQVYSDELKSSVTEFTQQGNAGTWQVVVDLKEFSGSVYFKLQKL